MTVLSVDFKNTINYVSINPFLLSIPEAGIFKTVKMQLY